MTTKTVVQHATQSASRVVSCRVSDQSLYEALWYMDNRNLSPATLSRLVSTCVELVASLARQLEAPKPRQSPTALLEERFGPANSRRRRLSEPQLLTEIRMVDEQVRLNTIKHSFRFEQPSQQPLLDLPRIFCSAEEEKRFYDYCQIKNLEPFKDISPEEWREQHNET